MTKLRPQFGTRRSIRTRRLMIEIHYLPGALIEWSICRPDKSARTPAKKWKQAATGAAATTDIGINCHSLLAGLGRVVASDVDADVTAISTRTRRP